MCTILCGSCNTVQPTRTAAPWETGSQSGWSISVRSYFAGLGQLYLAFERTCGSTKIVLWRKAVQAPFLCHSTYCKSYRAAVDQRCLNIGILFEEYVVDFQAQGGNLGYKCKSHSTDERVKGRLFPTPGILSLSTKPKHSPLVCCISLMNALVVLVHFCLTFSSDKSEKNRSTGEKLEDVTLSAGEIQRFNDSSEIVAEPSNGIWWPRKSNHEAVDFYRQPNELCQVTVNDDHNKLTMSTIFKEFEVSPGTHRHRQSLWNAEFRSWNGVSMQALAKFEVWLLLRMPRSLHPRQAYKVNLRSDQISFSWYEVWIACSASRLSRNLGRSWSSPMLCLSTFMM